MLKEQALPQALKLYIYMVIERLDLTNLTRTAENRDNFQKLNSNSAGKRDSHFSIISISAAELVQL